MLGPSLSVFLWLVASAAAFTLQGVLPNTSTHDPARTFIRLVSVDDFSTQKTVLRPDYSFSFEVAAGTRNELFVESLDYHFTPSRVFVEEVEGVLKGYRHHPGTAYTTSNDTEVALPLNVTVVRPRVYLEMRGGGLSGPLAMVWENKLVAGALLLGAFVLLGPSIMEAMYPGAAEQFKEAQKQAIRAKGIELDD